MEARAAQQALSAMAEAAARAGSLGAALGCWCRHARQRWRRALLEGGAVRHLRQSSVRRWRRQTHRSWRRRLLATDGERRFWEARTRRAWLRWLRRATHVSVTASLLAAAAIRATARARRAADDAEAPAHFIDALATADDEGKLPQSLALQHRAGLLRTAKEAARPRRAMTGQKGRQVCG